MYVKAKPFVKWVGGKGQLLKQLDAFLPADFGERQDVTYIEPFVGGGAMLFYMLQTYPNIRNAIINDINSDLITCYQVVRNQPDDLICSLSDIQSHYYGLKGESERKQFYMEVRERFNAKPADPILNTTLFFFLNRTCFNGLYRVNKSGKFNVPVGRYAHPLICDPDTILADSAVLQRVNILVGDFEQTYKFINNRTFFYFDPPYRPLSHTSNFKDYAKEAFNDESQIRLKKFCDRLHKANVSFMLSNSDGLNSEPQDYFFDKLFVDYDINRVLASRSVNSNGAKRGKLSEILVRNYTNK